MSRLVLTLVLCGLALLTSAHTIKHIIVVMEENRSFDHMLGWRSGVNGLNASRDCNFVDPLDPSKGQVCATNTAPNVALCDPNHDLPPTTYKIYGPKAFAEKNFTHPDMSGFVAWERSPNGWGKKDCPDCGVMEAFSVEHLPVMNGIADHFALFDSFHASIPGPTWPNRIMFMAATSGGLTETSNPWFLGETGSLFPQRTIFDQVASAGLKWKNYVNDTPWELFMESIAHNAENVVLMDEFFSDCRDGTLPHFAFINPRAGVNVTHAYGSNDQHPDHDIALGEMYYKDIYEALRASPQWNDTLLIITFDEHGGFYDHVPPPQHCPPPGDGLPAYPDPFSFDRLGIRIPTLLAGPWVPKGELISEPPAAAKPSPDSKYELTSIMATVRKILNITEGPLTARDAWAATFDHVLNKLDAPRTDCPLHLPNALPPSMFPHEEAELPINSLQQHISTVHAHLAGLPLPEHKRQGDVSEWLQSAFQVHKKATVAWKASKKSHGGRVGLPTDPQPSSALSVLCEPFIGQNPSFLASNWSISFNNTSPFRTISIDVFLSDGLRGGTFCLDTGDLSTIPAVPERGVDLATVGISKCYPSADPSRNRDKAQQWIHMGATIRPYQRQDLCLASNCLGEANQGGVRLQKPTTLRVCDNVISQHWSWQGPAAGNVGRQDEGMLSNGDAIFALVVDWSIVQKNQDQQQY